MERSENFTGSFGNFRVTATNAAKFQTCKVSYKTDYITVMFMLSFSSISSTSSPSLSSAFTILYP